MAPRAAPIWVSGRRPAVASNMLERSFEAPAANRKWIADLTHVETAGGDLLSRRVVGRPISAAMTAQLVTDALVMGSGKGPMPNLRCRRKCQSLSSPSLPTAAGGDALLAFRARILSGAPV
jgi:transposase InsO family protein